MERPERQLAASLLLTLTNRKTKYMRAYQLDFCGESRIIVHPLGLPPSWKESNLTPEQESDARAALAAIAGASPYEVAHFTPDLQLVTTYPCK